MKGINLTWTVATLTIFLFVAIAVKIHKNHESEPTEQNVQTQPYVEINVDPPKTPRLPNIKIQIPSHLSYPEIVSQIQRWGQEAPDITEIGFYGKTKRNVDICYIKICNKIETKERLKVLITGCIHGNEPWSTGCVMAYAGNLLGEYGKNKEITDLINSRDIYIIPVISPDSYPHSRYVDGVDPNRDFPSPSQPNHKSTPVVQAVQDFFLKIKPDAVISTHTFGRVFLTPFGDTKQKCLNENDYQRIVGEMGNLCNYKLKHACDLYRRPIHGIELDWYYRNGKCMPIVMEIGSHQRIPTDVEIKTEFHSTFDAILYFIKEAPLAASQWSPLQKYNQEITSYVEDIELGEDLHDE